MGQSFYPIVVKLHNQVSGKDERIDIEDFLAGSKAGCAVGVAPVTKYN